MVHVWVSTPFLLTQLIEPTELLFTGPFGRNQLCSNEPWQMRTFPAGDRWRKGSSAPGGWAVFANPAYMVAEQRRVNATLLDLPEGEIASRSLIELEPEQPDRNAGVGNGVRL
jgi:hypothetical protein